MNLARFRWWILALILVVALGLLGWVWGVLDTPRQDRVVKTTSILSTGALALLLIAVAFQWVRTHGAAVFW